MLVRKSIIGSTLATVTFGKKENEIVISWIGDSQIILKRKSGT